MTDLTYKQIQRQRYRTRRSGQYAKVNPCQGCGKSAGVDYFSHPLTDSTGDDGEAWGDTALCLCAKCADRTAGLRTVAQFTAYAAKKQKRAADRESV